MCKDEHLNKGCGALEKRVESQKFQCVLAPSRALKQGTWGPCLTRIRTTLSVLKGAGFPNERNDSLLAFTP